MWVHGDDDNIDNMMTIVSTNHGFLCTMHSLQCNCASDLFGHPQGWNDDNDDDDTDDAD